MAPSGAMRRGTAPALQPAIGCLAIEEALRGSGYRTIVGIDDVGRGCWAGPVCAGAVILHPDCYTDRALLAQVTDSKLLAPAKRVTIATIILQHSLAAAVAWVGAPVIDQVNILGATRLAMAAALASVGGAAVATAVGCGAYRLTASSVVPDFALIDAVRLPDVTLPQRAIVRADRHCLAVAAASIIAKVYRDDEMRRLHEQYPAYDFARNKGYGTRRHLHGLRHAGLTPLHRRSFAPMKYLLSLRDHVAGALPARAG